MRHIAVDIDGNKIPLTVELDHHGVTIRLDSDRVVIVDVGSVGKLQVAFQSDESDDAEQLEIYEIKSEDVLPTEELPRGFVKGDLVTFPYASNEYSSEVELRGKVIGRSKRSTAELEVQVNEATYLVHNCLCKKATT